MYIFNTTRVIRKIIVNKVRYFIFENYYRQIGSKKDIQLLATCLTETILDPGSAREHC